MMNPAEFANIAKAERDLWWYRGMRDILYGLLDQHTRGRSISRVLEAGCGTGYQSHLLEKRYGWRMFPADLEWKGLRYARDLELNRLSQCNIAALPFAADSFDLVACLDVLVHFPKGEDHRPIAELVRTLAPGGLLVLRVSALDLLRSRHSEYVLERQRYTRERLRQAVEQCGIRVLRCTYANSLLLPVSLFKFRVFEPVLRKPPASGVEPVPAWLDRMLGRFLELEARWISSGRDFAAGQSLLLVGTKPS